jgi:hypothetical protein
MLKFDASIFGRSADGYPSAAPHRGAARPGSKGLPNGASDCPRCLCHHLTCRRLPVGKQIRCVWSPNRRLGEPELASPRGHHSALRRSLGALALLLGGQQAWPYKQRRHLNIESLRINATGLPRKPRRNGTEWFEPPAPTAVAPCLPILEDTTTRLPRHTTSSHSATNPP